MVPLIEFPSADKFPSYVSLGKSYTKRRFPSRKLTKLPDRRRLALVEAVERRTQPALLILRDLQHHAQIVAAGACPVPCHVPAMLYFGSRLLARAASPVLP